MKSNNDNLWKILTRYPWWGKLLGAFFGFLIAGSIGALFGIFVGNFFDMAVVEHYKNPYWHYHQEKRESIQTIFFRTTFSIMGYIAKSDGRVSELEIQTAQHFMKEMRLNQSEKKMAQQFFNAGKDVSFDLNHLLTLFEQASFNNHELLILFIDIQYRAAKMGGFFEKKQDALDNIFLRFGFAPLRYQYRFYEDFGTHENTSQSSHQDSNQQQRNQYQGQTTYRGFNTLAQAYAILEITEESSKEEVRRAYRRLISKNHPDKLIAKKLPEEMIKAATDKTQKIRKAYEQICISKGWQF